MWCPGLYLFLRWLSGWNAVRVVPLQVGDTAAWLYSLTLLAVVVEELELCSTAHRAGRKQWRSPPLVRPRARP